MKFLKGLAAILMVIVSLTACAPAESKKIDKLTVIFVPSKDAATILTAVEPLKQLIIDEMDKTRLHDQLSRYLCFGRLQCRG